MRQWYYIGIAGLMVFELANVYFIMPMPGSQRMNSLGLAYFLYSWRWIFRIVCLALILSGIKPSWKRSKLLVSSWLLVGAAVVYLFNFNMAAERLFKEPVITQMVADQDNQIAADKLVIGVVLNGEARAYPVQLIAYHHKVSDTVGGKHILVTYCSVCRTGRVYEPSVDGKQEIFRLVGMDHFNAMFEDHTTGSWWRQATGEAIAGKYKGKTLPEVPCMQVTLAEWLKMYPQSLVLQADPTFKESIDHLANYDKGNMKGKLTKSDTASWNEKSWVLGVLAGNAAKAYDWNRLQRETIVIDQVGNAHILIWMLGDTASFLVFEIPEGLGLTKHSLTSEGELLVSEQGISIDRHGRMNNSKSGETMQLKPGNGYQEFWHSWRTFHPLTERY